MKLAMKMITTTKIFNNVKLGENCIIEEFCIIGGEKEIIIGDNCKIRSHTVIYGGNKIGTNFQTGHKVNIRDNNDIGDNVSIGTHSIVEHHVKIEDNVRIHSDVFVPEFSILKKGCWLGPKVCLTNAKYPSYPEVKDNLKGPIIEEEAKIGANSIILPGVRVGKNALVGAGSVVTRDVPDGEIWTGNPARFIKKSEEVGYK
ncbi:MAG: DapH/DapD/GlmU-related protein [archaeon]